MVLSISESICKNSVLEAHQQTPASHNASFEILNLNSRLISPLNVDYSEVERAFLYTTSKNLQISSLEEYKQARICDMYTNHGGLYRKDGLYDEYIKNMDFEKEFENYLEYKNVGSESELRALSENINANYTKVFSDELPSLFFNQDYDFYYLKAKNHIFIQGKEDKISVNELMDIQRKAAFDFSIRDRIFTQENKNCYSSILDRSINSLEDYIQAYKKANPLTFEECCKQKLDGVDAWEKVDFEKEFENYMQLRGCNTLEELKALNETEYATTQDLKDFVNMKLQSFWCDIFGDENVGVYSEGSECFNFSLHVISNLSFERLVQFKHDLDDGINNNIYVSRMNSFRSIKKMLSEVPENFDIGFKYKKYFTAIDVMIDMFKEASEKEAKRINPQNEDPAIVAKLNEAKAMFAYLKFC